MSCPLQLGRASSARYVSDHHSEAGNARRETTGPHIAAGADSYLAVWEDWRNEGTSGVDVYGQLLDSSGNLSGTVIAISTATDDQRGPSATYAWSFGDGSVPATTAVPTATHTYVATGTFDVGLTVEGPGGSDTLTRTGYVTVYPPAVRVEEGLVVLYTFEEGSGITVGDVSGVGSALDLTIANAGAVS
jgi:hypothetical protein